MDEDTIIGEIETQFPEFSVHFNERMGRIWIREVPKDSFKQCLEFLKEELKFGHLTTITADDDTEKIRIIYHLIRDIEERGSLNLQVDIEREPPTISTVTDIYPSANLYEREVFDLVGVEFKGHPNLKRLMQPEDVPEDMHPLRKEKEE